MPDCGERAAHELGVSWLVSLVCGANTTEADAVSETRALARYYAEYGVAFHMDAPPALSSNRYLITGSHQELDRALDQAAIPRGEALTPEEQERADRVTAEVLFGPLTAFLLEPAPTGSPDLKLAVFEQVIDPTFLGDLGLSGKVTGLGFSPMLFRRLRALGKDLGLFELLELPEEFTPSAVYSHDALSDLPYPDNAVAHEVGHARGLVHVADSANLMHPSVGSACRAGVTPEQLRDLAGIDTPEPEFVDSSARDGLVEQLGVLLDVHRAATSRALEARFGSVRSR